MYGASASWVRMTSTASPTRTPPNISACHVGGNSTRLGEVVEAVGALESDDESRAETSEQRSRPQYVPLDGPTGECQYAQASWAP